MAVVWPCLAQRSITGVVHDAATADPLPGATLTVADTRINAVTDEWGRFRLDKMPAGRVVVTTRFAGYATKSDTLDESELFLEVRLEQVATLMGEVIVSATRSDSETPSTFQTLNRRSLERQNFGQDLPIALTWTPSLVTTSDAGTGIGYTGFRIRGSDPTRINVTINGIPLNDSESQSVYWVNTPDFLSSVQSLQIQRGVGTSTNGAGAFGATVNLQSLSFRPEPYAGLLTSFGSFNTRRLTAKLGTGLIGNWSFEGRLSKVKSDGYVDRATSDLDAYYLSGGYFGKRTKAQLIAFGGHEVTYQAWYGVDSETMKVSRTFNYAGAIYDSLGEVRQYYGNEVDDYAQRHLQLHLYHELKPRLILQGSFSWTDGEGFFEQYLQARNRNELGLADLIVDQDTVTNNDFVVRRWLDNRLLAATFAIQKESDRADVTIGGSYSSYRPALHFGEIIWAEYAGAVMPGHPYYSGQSRKLDFNIYSKVSYRFADRWSAYIDLQYRGLSYESNGVDADQSFYLIDDSFNFFNPKAGLTYSISEANMLYSTYAMANREPTRADYLDGEDVPRSERLHNVEAGWKRRTDHITFELNGYLMAYQDQLVFTGEVNDTGYPIRSNVGESFRAGIEVSGTTFLNRWVTWNANLAGSVNKNKSVRVADANGDLTEYKNTDIVLSPNWVAGSQLTWAPTTRFQLTWLSKFVSRQYLDNSQNSVLSLDSYWVNDLRLMYSLPLKDASTVEISALVNNVLNEQYESNGYAYGGSAYFFPQAGTNFLIMLGIRI